MPTSVTFAASNGRPVPALNGRNQDCTREPHRSFSENQILADDFSNQNVPHDRSHVLVVHLSLPVTPLASTLCHVLPVPNPLGNLTSQIIPNGSKTGRRMLTRMIFRKQMGSYLHHLRLLQCWILRLDLIPWLVWVTCSSHQETQDRLLARPWISMLSWPISVVIMSAPTTDGAGSRGHIAARSVITVCHRTSLNADGVCCRRAIDVGGID